MQRIITLQVTQRQVGVEPRADACFGSACRFRACWRIAANLGRNVLQACPQHVGEACANLIARCEMEANNAEARRG